MLLDRSRAAHDRRGRVVDELVKGVQGMCGRARRASRRDDQRQRRGDPPTPRNARHRDANARWAASSTRAPRLKYRRHPSSFSTFPVVVGYFRCREVDDVDALERRPNRSAPQRRRALARAASRTFFRRVRDRRGSETRETKMRAMSRMMSAKRAFRETPRTSANGRDALASLATDEVPYATGDDGQGLASARDSDDGVDDSTRDGRDAADAARLAARLAEAEARVFHLENQLEHASARAESAERPGASAAEQRERAAFHSARLRPRTRECRDLRAGSRPGRGRGRRRRRTGRGRGRARDRYHVSHGCNKNTREDFGARAAEFDDDAGARARFRRPPRDARTRHRRI